MVKNKKCIGIALPHASRSIQYPGTHENMRRAMDYADKRGYEFLVSDPSSASVASNRNVAANTLLKGGADWIFTCDDDMFYPEDIFIKLIEHDKDIVSGLYVGRSAPFPIMAFNPHKETGVHQTIKHTDFKRGDVIEVCAVGGGCVFIKREVFEKIPSPWYCMPPAIWLKSLIWLHKQLGMGFPTKEIPKEILPESKDINPDVWDGGVTGEDVYFCLLAGAFGYKIYLDTGIECAHIGDYKHTLDDHRAYEKIMEYKGEVANGT